VAQSSACQTSEADIEDPVLCRRPSEELSIARMASASRAGKRRVRIPEAPFAEIALKIAI
jgi:hypothetical protein